MHLSDVTLDVTVLSKKKNVNDCSYVKLHIWCSLMKPSLTLFNRSAVGTKQQLAPLHCSMSGFLPGLLQHHPLNCYVPYSRDWSVF